MTVTITRGGTPSPAELAAITAAAAALLDEEAARPRDPTPRAYRSRWRAAAVREGIRSSLDVTTRR